MDLWLLLKFVRKRGKKTGQLMLLQENNQSHPEKCVKTICGVYCKYTAIYLPCCSQIFVILKYIWKITKYLMLSVTYIQIIFKFMTSNAKYKTKYGSMVVSNLLGDWGRVLCGVCVFSPCFLRVFRFHPTVQRHVNSANWLL